MRNKLFILVLILIILFGGINKNLSFAKKNINFFNEILTKVNGSVEEYGIKTVVNTKEDSENYCNKILKSLNLKDVITNITKESNIYCIEFRNNNIYGYIESTKGDSYNTVTLNIIKKGSTNGINSLEKLVDNALGENYNKAKYFQYIKAQIPSKDIYKTNKDIEVLLKDNGVKNIDTVKIENGYTSTAYTGKYPVIKNNGKYIDFNYALCSYTSGNYIIIGTPIIIETY
ncbi:TATA-box binding [Clostridium sp. USBA 49]|jgi:hypothetical protein|uniref:YwmB family TATA-box binding protein n=1 Tax=Clostridium TaxID=1485 RepID=UPI00099AAC24|nr:MULTISPECIES: YwmB family TATA-box binding protein [Clostridium]SKA81237.1 TATA-box binding [Clostridium sp. USBA 49]